MIPYIIDAGVSNAVRNNFEWAVKTWNANTCIRILPAGSPGTGNIWGKIKVISLQWDPAFVTGPALKRYTGNSL